MKKTFSVVLALLMVLSVCTFASAEGKDYSGYTIRCLLYTSRCV